VELGRASEKIRYAGPCSPNEAYISSAPNSLRDLIDKITLHYFFLPQTLKSPDFNF